MSSQKFTNAKELPLSAFTKASYKEVSKQDFLNAYNNDFNYEKSLEKQSFDCEALENETAKLKTPLKKFSHMYLK